MPFSAHALDEPLLALRSRYFAPAVLSPFADDLAGRLSRLAAGPVLELLADIGTLTQAAAASIAVGTALVATDPDGDRLAWAEAKPGTAAVTWRQADPCALPFQDATFGSVTCLFGIAGVSGRIEAFREARRVLKPGGRFLFSVPGPLRQSPVAACVQQALAALFAGDPPRYLPSDLHSYGEAEVIDDDLTSAGFTDASYTIVDLPFSARGAADIAMGYCLGTPLRTELETRIADLRPAVAAVEAALRTQFGDGPVTSTMRANVISAAG